MIEQLYRVNDAVFYDGLVRVFSKHLGLSAFIQSRSIDFISSAVQTINKRLHSRACTLSESPRGALIYCIDSRENLWRTDTVGIKTSGRLCFIS